jgi:hypothetical protein
MENPGLWICGLFCGLPALISLVVAFLVRSLARRRLTMNVEHSAIPLPDLTPGFKRMAVYFDLEERKSPAPKSEEEE